MNINSDKKVSGNDKSNIKEDLVYKFIYFLILISISIIMICVVQFSYILLTGLFEWVKPTILQDNLQFRGIATLIFYGFYVIGMIQIAGVAGWIFGGLSIEIAVRLDILHVKFVKKSSYISCMLVYLLFLETFNIIISSWEYLSATSWFLFLNGIELWQYPLHLVVLVTIIVGIYVGEGDVDFYFLTSTKVPIKSTKSRKKQKIKSKADIHKEFGIEPGKNLRDIFVDNTWKGKCLKVSENGLKKLIEYEDSSFGTEWIDSSRVSD